MERKRGRPKTNHSERDKYFLHVNINHEKEEDVSSTVKILRKKKKDSFSSENQKSGEYG